MGKSIDKEKLYADMEKCYAELAYTDLAMIYYSFCEKDESPEESGRNVTSVAKKYRDRLEVLIRGCFGATADVRSQGSEAYRLRSDIKDVVNRMVDRRERIALDEYVKEREGDSEEPFNYSDDDDAARKILQAIFMYDDNPTINENIKTAVYELPVRMTKGRFFDILEDGLKKYIGGPMDAITRAVYMIESAAGLRGETPLDFTADDAKILDAEIEYLNDIAELCNYVCVLSECSDELLEASSKKAEFLKKIVELSSASLSDEADEAFCTIEGEIEKLSENQVVYEGRFDSLTEANGGSMNDAERRLDRMKRLMSASVYAELENEDETEITAETAAKVFGTLSAELDESFKNGSRELNRARMAAVLSSLPVFFNSRTDCMNYVRESLSGCRNNHEKNVAVGNVLHDISLL